MVFTLMGYWQSLVAASAPSEEASGLDRLLGFLSTSLVPVYGFRSLLNFKREFQPELRPRCGPP